MKSDNGSLGESFKTVGAPHVWEGQELEVKSDLLVDNLNSGAVILRSFYFKANPEAMKRDRPTKQRIFDTHWPQLRVMLYSDGLEAFEGIEPKIIIPKKRDEYKIFIACIPRKGVVLDQKPLTLQEIMKPNGN